ncbi:MAG: PLP-dependent aminotransferase family protein [Actinomycetia bacterium]|nr:PLP-dependent aminotransferase family protein [Actinomycetes bacterium]
MEPLDDRRIEGHHLSRILGDWKGTDAAYAGLAARIRLLVLDGRLPLQTRIPAERELATALGVSRTTVAAAYERLRDEGFLISRRGSGTWTAVPETGHRGGPHTASLAPGAPLDLAHAAPSAPVEILHQAASSAVAQLARYLPTHGYDPYGLSPLRVAIADRYTARGLPTSPEQILVTGGAQAAISLVLRMLAKPGDRIAVEHPSYANALDAIARAGCRAVPFGFTTPGWDLDMLAATIRQAVPRLAYLIPDFHNPTGRCMDAGQRTELAELARRTRTPLVIDETIAELGLDFPAPPPVSDAGGLVLHVGSASKTFWGGLRIGWLRASAQLVGQAATVRAAVDTASPVFEQLVTAELLRRTDEILPARLDDLRARRGHLLTLLHDQAPGWRAPVPPGGLSLWTDLGAPTSTAITVAARRQGLLLAAGPRFGLDGAFENYLRLPYTLTIPELDVAFARLLAAAAAAGLEPVTDEPAAGLV